MNASLQLGLGALFWTAVTVAYPNWVTTILGALG